jgi:formylmethanofuran dehydrogenase subunit E-like metal-binding protein
MYLKKEEKMLKKIIILTILLTLPMMIGTVFADSNTMTGTLSAMFDENSGTVTAMFVGYAEGNPVIIGPTTWECSAKEFSDATAEDISNKLCGSDHDLKRVTKSTHTDKEVVAEVIISSQNAPILVGR